MVGGVDRSFSRLYKLRREDEKNQAELAEWLARFVKMTLCPMAW